MEQLSLLCACGKHPLVAPRCDQVDEVFGVWKAHDLAERCISARLGGLAERRVEELSSDGLQGKKMKEER